MPHELCCPICQKRGIITVLVKSVEEAGSVVLLIKPRATKILRKSTTTQDGKDAVNVVIRVKCPRCKNSVPLPGRLLLEV